MLQTDLKAAGIPYVDAAGLFADFHALRHSYITNLGSAGVPLSAAQKLARHSTPTLTAVRYTHLDLAEQAKEVQKLPALPLGCDLGCSIGTKERKSAPHGTSQADPKATSGEAQNEETPRNAGFPALPERRGRDSNPGGACTPTGFRDRHIRPLCHLSRPES
jgi:hypothetical protein